MQIVIDIPEGLRDDFEREVWTALTCMEMKDALQNGTVLPEIHGDLVDKNAALLSLRDYVKGKKTIGQCIDNTLVLVKAKVPQEGVE